MKILILGGSTDIGLELAKYFKNMGDMVISTYNNHKIDVDYEMIHLNVKDEDEVREVFRYVNDKYGKIDMIINLFSISHDNLFRDSSKSELMDVLEVNMGGTYLTNKIFNEYITRQSPEIQEKLHDDTIKVVTNVIDKGNKIEPKLFY